MENSTEQSVSPPAPDNSNEVDALAPERRDEDTEARTKKGLVTDEMEGTANDTGKSVQDRAPDIHKEDQDIETLTNKQLVNDELAGTTPDTVNEGHEQACDIHREDQEIETPRNNAELEKAATSIVKEIMTVEVACGNSRLDSPIQLSNPENSIHSENADLDIQNEDQEKYTSLKEITIGSTAEEETSDHTNSNPFSGHSSQTFVVKHQSVEQTGVETHQKEVEASVHMKSLDISNSGCEVDDNLNELQCHIERSVSEETGETKRNLEDILYGKKEPALNGTEQPEMEPISISAWPEKAAALSNFVRAKSLVAVSNVFRRLSGKSEEGDNALEDEEKAFNFNDTNTKEINVSNKSEVQGSGLSTVEKPGWSPLSFIGSFHDKAINSMKPIAMRGRIILYTRLGCEHCKEARRFLHKKRLTFVEINIDVYPSRKLELEKLAGSSAVPRVFFNEVLVGGLNDLKLLDESGALEEKIEYLATVGPPSGAPLPPLSGEDDVSSSGSVDELAVIVLKMKGSIVVKDRFYKLRRVTNCFLGSEAVDFISEDQYLEREEAIEFGRKLARQLFFQHVLDENVFEDGSHPYRFLDQDPPVTQCQNIPRGIIQLKPKPLVEISSRLRFLLYAILEAYVSEDGKHVDYRTIHGSEEFARYLRIAEELQRIDLNKTAKEERLAFFINLYNMMAIHAILVWGHPVGALERRRLLGEFKYVIGGCTYSLSDIHNGILRGNQRPPYTLIRPFGVTDKRFKVALPYPEPLIHFALVSGNRSGPALRCYSPKNIDAELTEAAGNFLRSGAFTFDIEARTVSVSEILKWYSVDFGRSEVEVLKHAANYLESEQSRTLLDLLDSTQLKVVYQPYDWCLNS